MKELDRRDMSCIVDGLYLSNLAASNDARLLKENKITCVISILNQHKTEQDIQKYRRLDIKHFEFYLPDVPDAPIFLLFDNLEKIIRSEIQSGGRVLVHCRAGVSRSATIVIMYLMRDKKISFDEAIRTVRQKRPIVNPNIGFRNQLLKFA
jgi:atypical dual specificity phosphatase